MSAYASSFPTFPITRTADGRALINLGSSARVAPGWTNVDFSWLMRLSRYPLASAMLHRYRLLSDERYERLRRLHGNAILWDLRRGIPFPDKTFDAVYHSHVLEHISRDHAPGFLRECLRVLKPGGVLRIAVPDLELLAADYLSALRGFDAGDESANPGAAAEAIFDQMIARIPRERAQRSPVVRVAENWLIGDTDRNGTLHRWMYDRVSLGALLTDCGYEEVLCQTAASSAIAGWSSFHLDTNPDGSSYKPESLYMEGTRSTR